MAGTPDSEYGETALNIHNFNFLLLYTFLLILSVVTMWMFKRRRLRSFMKQALLLFGMPAELPKLPKN